MTALSLSLSHSTASVNATLTVPYLFVSGISSPGGDDEADGLGDAYIDADFYTFGDYAKGAYGGPAVGIKLPTGDEGKGLGTGEIDFSVGLHGGYAAAAATPYFRVVREFIGDTPDGNLRDGWSFTAGLLFRHGEKDTWSVFIEDRDSIDPGRDEVVTLYGYYRRELGAGSWLTVMPYAGLSDTAADFGISLGLGMEWGPR